MMSNEDKDRVATEIGRLFEGLELSDVASIMAVQLAMLSAQGGQNLEEAVEFLDEIRDDAEQVLESIDFDEMHDDEDEVEDDEDETDEDGKEKGGRA